MKKSKQNDSVFAKLQNKLSSKNKTPWYRQGKFVGPLVAVVVLSAVVLGVINERTNLFQGSCFTPDCYDFNAEQTAENEQLLQQAVADREAAREVLYEWLGAFNLPCDEYDNEENNLNILLEGYQLTQEIEDDSVRLMAERILYEEAKSCASWQNNLVINEIISLDDSAASCYVPEVQRVAGLIDLATAEKQPLYYSLLLSSVGDCSDDVEIRVSLSRLRTLCTEDAVMDTQTRLAETDSIAAPAFERSYDNALSQCGLSPDSLFSQPDTDGAQGGTGDIEAPVINITSSTSSSSLSYTLTGTVTDDLGVNNGALGASLNGGAFQTINLNESTGAFSRSFTLEGNIGNVFKVRATDISGNVTEVTHNVFVLGSGDDNGGSTGYNLDLNLGTGIEDLDLTPEGRDRLGELFAVASVDLSPELNVLLLGNTKQLNAEVLSASGTTLQRDLTWTTNNPSVATVNNSGVVTGVSVGDATITVSVVGQTSIQDSVKVAVREREEIPQFPGDQPPAEDTTDPVVTISSANVTTSVNYVVSGRVQDDSAIQLATVSVNGSNEKALILDSEGQFVKTVVLTPGVNSLEVTAIDAAGNEGSATKSVLVSTDADPAELAVSISFDAGLDSPVDPLRPQLRGTVPFDKVVVNLYDDSTDQAIYTVFQHCLTGQAGCSYYSTSQYTEPVRNLDITNWAFANLTNGSYYYKAYAKRGNVAVEDYSGKFTFVDSGPGVLPDLPLHPCDYYFTDVPAGIPACGAVALVRELGIFYGNVDQYGQRVFRPNDPLLRTELFAIANRFARLPQATYNPNVDGNMGFKDLNQFVNNPEAYWFMAEIKRMRQFGSNIIQGYQDGTLRPLVPILVAENAKVILEAGFAGNVIAAAHPPIDLTKAPWWADYEAFLASRGVSFGQPGGEVITRSEVAQFFADLYLRGLLR